MDPAQASDDDLSSDSGTLWLIRPASPEGGHAPEFEYLTSWVDLQIRRAFGHREPRRATVEEVRRDAADEDRVLWLASERVLVARATLERLARALADDPQGGVAATPVAALPDLAERPVYTLAGFERRETHRLATENGTPEDTRNAPVHAGLFTGDEFRRRTNEPGSSDPVTGDSSPLPRFGLSHEFIDYYGELRRDVLPHVPPAAQRILEVGCGRGVTGEALKAEREATVVGVELNPVVAREATERLDAVVSGDIEDPAVARRLRDHGPFDLVLALELFEHLARPEDFLLRAAELLKPDGAILLSTPNVGHYSVVEDLLAGRWDYLPVGLLCYTHLRFFTRRTLEDWLSRLGFERFRLIPQTTEEWPRLEAVERALGETPSGERSSGVALDRQSLCTQGFFVLIERRGMIRREDRRMTRETCHDP